MYLNPRPAPGEMGAYYPSDYAAYRVAIEDERFALMRLMRRRKLSQRRALIEHYSRRKTGRLLDVGCATGLFLHEMAQAGWQVRGVEPSASAASYAASRFGLEIFQGLLASAPFDEGSFDCITYWDVLEHTYSPRAELALAAQLLRPGGLFVANVPNWHSMSRFLFGRYWSGFDAPRHLYVFKRTALARLLAAAGFAILDWRCFMPSYWGFTTSVDRWLTASAPHLAPPVERFFGIPGMRLPFEPWFSLVNLWGMGDNLTVFARKR